MKQGLPVAVLPPSGQAKTGTFAVSRPTLGDDNVGWWKSLQKRFLPAWLFPDSVCVVSGELHFGEDEVSEVDGFGWDQETASVVAVLVPPLGFFLLVAKEARIQLCRFEFLVAVQ